MICFECASQGERTDAAGICHHCAAGLCASHAVVISDPVLIHQPVARVVELPRRARLLLCRTCLEALRQHHIIEERLSTATTST